MGSAEIPQNVNFGSWSFEIDLRSGVIRRLCLGDSEVAYVLGVRKVGEGSGLTVDAVNVATEQSPEELKGVIKANLEGVPKFELSYRVVDKGGIQFNVTGDQVQLFCEVPSIGDSPKPHRVLTADGGVKPLESGQWENLDEMAAEKFEIAASPFANVELSSTSGEIRMSDLRSDGRPAFEVKVSQGAGLSFELIGPPRRILAINLGRDPQISITTSRAFQRPSIGVELDRIDSGVREILTRIGLDHVSVSSDLACEAAACGFLEKLGIRLHVEAGEPGGLMKETEPNALLGRAAVFLFRGSEASELAESRAHLQKVNPTAMFALGGARAGRFSINVPPVESGWLPSCGWSLANLEEASLMSSLGMLNEVDRKLASANAPTAVISPVGWPAVSRAAARSWLVALFAKASVVGRTHSLTFDSSLLDALSADPSLGVLFEWMRGFERVHASPCTIPRDVASFCIVDSRNKLRMIVANLTAIPQSVRVKSGSGRATLMPIDGSDSVTTIEARGGKLQVDLQGYEVVRLDLGA